MKWSQLATIALVLATAACSNSDLSGVLASTCEELGICTRPPPAPEQFVLVIDGSPGSTANAASAEAVLGAVLERAVTRPGSRIRVWSVGTGAVDSREIAAAVVPPPPRRLRNPRAYRTETTARLRTTLIAPSASALEAAARQRRSAVAETLTLAARSFVPGSRRLLFVVSDLREKSGPRGLDLECPRRLPSTSVFNTYVGRRGLLAAGSFDGIEVVVVDHALPPFPARPHCDCSVRRSDGLFALWRDRLLAAGARRVLRAHGAATLSLDDETALVEQTNRPRSRR